MTVLLMSYSRHGYVGTSICGQYGVWLCGMRAVRRALSYGYTGLANIVASSPRFHCVAEERVGKHCTKLKAVGLLDTRLFSLLSWAKEGRRGKCGAGRGLDGARTAFDSHRDFIVAFLLASFVPPHSLTTTRQSSHTAERYFDSIELTRTRPLRSINVGRSVRTSCCR